jgi:hypothetical protein
VPWLVEDTARVRRPHELDQALKVLGCHLVAVQLDRLAAIEAQHQPTTAIQVRGIRAAEQRHAGFLFVHPQNQARGEVREQRALRNSQRISRAGDEPQSRPVATYEPLQVGSCVAECRQFWDHDDEFGCSFVGRRIDADHQPFEGATHSVPVGRINGGLDVWQLGQRGWQPTRRPHDRQPRLTR